MGLLQQSLLENGPDRENNSRRELILPAGGEIESTLTLPVSQAREETFTMLSLSLGWSKFAFGVISTIKLRLLQLFLKKSHTIVSER